MGSNCDEEVSLIQAVRKKNLRKVQALVSAGKHVELTDSNGWTSIHHAAYVGDLAVLEFLLGKNSRTCRERLARRSWLEETPLIVACSIPQINHNVVQFMLSLGADVNARTNSNRTPLWYACSFSGNLKVIKMLIDMGADTNISAEAKTPIECAFLAKLEVETLKYLIPRIKLPFTVTYLRDFLRDEMYKEIIPLAFNKIKPYTNSLIGFADNNNNSYVVCLLLQGGCNPIHYFSRPNALPYRDFNNFEEIFEALPSRELSSQLLEIILKHSKYLDKSLNIILKRLYDEEVDIKLHQESYSLSPELCLLMSRYILITPYSGSTLRLASRKGAFIYLISRFGNSSNAFKWISSSKLPKAVKDYFIELDESNLMRKEYAKYLETLQNIKHFRP